MNTPESSGRSQRLFSRLLSVAAFALAAWVAFSFSFTPLRTSQDEFWHLKTGQWICEHGRLPQNEIFTYTAADQPWYNHEWLSQVLMWRIYELGDTAGLGGLRLVILFKSLTIVLAFAGFGLLLARGMKEGLWAALAAALMAALARRTFYPRPPFITYLLLALLFWLLIEWREGRLRARFLFLLVPLFALWANLHGAWAAGLIVIGAFWAEAAWRLAWAKLRKEPAGPARRTAILLSALGAACLLATLANPYGYRLYNMFGHVMSDQYLLRSINEMTPPDWSYVWVLEGTILLLGALAIRPVTLIGMLGTLFMLVILHRVLRMTPNPWVHTAIALPLFAAATVRLHRPGWLAHLLLIAFFSYQGIQHVRHLPLMALMILPTLAWGLEAWSEDVEGRWMSRRPAGAEQARRKSPLKAQLRTLIPGFGALALLAFFWTFANASWTSAMPRNGTLAQLRSLIERQLGHLEWPSNFARNLMLARGIEMQPVPVDTRTPKGPLPSHLPQGCFMIQPYPVDAVNFLLRARLPGPLWNGGNYAGYLMWRLAPEKYKVFTDNRYDIYGGIVIRQEHSVLNGWTKEFLKRQGVGDDPRFIPWDKVLDKWKVQTIFLPAEAPVSTLLARGGWTRVWEDYEFNIWVRATKENQGAIERARAIASNWPPPVVGVVAKF